MATVYFYKRRYVSSVTGLAKVYRVRLCQQRAPDLCAIDMARTELRRDGNRWRAGPHGRRYQNVTVQQLIATGHARRDGDVVRRT
jgi:hypothetical protein